MVQNNDGSQIDGLPTSSHDDDLFTIEFDDLVMETKPIGKGSFGLVQKASYFGTEVAVKSLSSLVNIDPDLYKFMQREIRILKGMRHPNIVQFIGACNHDERYMIVTEYINSGDLHQFLKSKGQSLSWSTKIKLANDIASAFAFLHAKKVIFRDLKAKNVLVEEHGSTVRAKVCDFGFARIFDVTHQEKQDKQQGYLTICGSETTMAPEVIIANKYDETCDVYSYGILLYEMMCGIRAIKMELKRTPENAFDFDADKADSFVPMSCPKVFNELARMCVSYEPKGRPTFKTIVMGLTELLSKPIESLELKGGPAAMQSPRAVWSPLSPNGTPSSEDDSPTGSLSMATTDESGSVVYNSVVLNNESAAMGTNNVMADLMQRKLKHKITSSSFFKPPPNSADGSVVGSSTTTTHGPQADNDFDDDDVPSALLTSLTLDEIRYRDPSIYEDPDAIIREKKRFLSSPNLSMPSTTSTTSTSAPDDNDAAAASSKDGVVGLATTWGPGTKQKHQTQGNGPKKSSKKPKKPKKNKKR
ncbi:hypothetical protein SAMD00019534_019970 [Acytostelium subglobosum LB1]|uniref:hypothetical protein n=1 Tax=Acytostelium subglobosum LB1 TaxID=1410327 RepID=UPI000644E6D4|nr:hypothetical protein SAMD00019534_019970 [Acytostelium subglobosum LB1]GAM18822.1 hypothetical protein SAMD00019534_019970 [Acytostelium subglobosum LB1]|eukprot:XP_012758042.1 hypothetical protein SAMD00019534_019970 [Acytostelium subglobosum LB1]